MDINARRGPDKTRSLSALSLSGVTLTPAFAAETTVKASVSDGHASVVVKVNGVVDQDGLTQLAVGSGNVIAAVVTAQDRETSRTYTGYGDEEEGTHL